MLYNAAWNGFKVPEWWLFDEENYHIATETLDTIEDDNGQLIGGRPNGESYAKSVLDFNDTFSLTLNYGFDRTRGENQYGFVLPELQKNNPKLSFVANSGVKIGNTLGSSAGGGGYEIAILDVGAMVSMVGGMNEFELIDKKGIRDNGIVALIPVPNFIDTQKDVFTAETLNKLMHGIGYDMAYSKMRPFYHAFGNHPSNLKFCNTLYNNVENTGPSGSLIIQKTINHGNSLLIVQ